MMVSTPGETDLAAVRLVDHKHFVPEQNSCGLPLAASPPAETCQGLIIASHPRVTLLPEDNGKKNEKEEKYGDLLRRKTSSFIR